MKIVFKKLTQLTERELSIIVIKNLPRGNITENTSAEPEPLCVEKSANTSETILKTPLPLRTPTHTKLFSTSNHAIRCRNRLKRKQTKKSNKNENKISIRPDYKNATTLKEKKLQTTGKKNKSSTLKLGTAKKNIQKCVN